MTEWSKSKETTNKRTLYKMNVEGLPNAIMASARKPRYIYILILRCLIVAGLGVVSGGASFQDLSS